MSVFARELPPPVVVDEAEWQRREAAHRERMSRWTGPHRERAAAGEAHPVLDFLFTYYSERPSRLERWTPGVGVALAGESAAKFLDRTGFVRTAAGVEVDLARLTGGRRRTVEFVHALLSATANRPARLNCFGLHEWAMVYRQSASAVRHSSWPLRLGPDGTDEVVEAQQIRCGHYDAFRFFTPDAVPRNDFQPRREDQVRLEQPGCLHAGMDLYKWCYKLSPFLPAELVADCFELAVEIRELDMRASPYDLSALGYDPVPIETAAGRAEYTRLQADFARRTAPLRARLIEYAGRLLAASAPRAEASSYTSV